MSEIKKKRRYQSRWEKRTPKKIVETNTNSSERDKRAMKRKSLPCEVFLNIIPEKVILSHLIPSS